VHIFKSFTMDNNKIREVAHSFIGQNEIKNNMGFVNKHFYTQMTTVGFVPSYAWCVLFAKLCWKLGGESRYIYLKPSVIKTLSSMSKQGYELELKPCIGAIAVYRKFVNGIPQTPGHACIVVHIEAGTFWTIDGNTSKQNETEGTTVATRIRTYKWKIDNGYRLLGFYNPIM